MKTIKLNRDQLVKFFFDQNKKIENYNFDLFHDIAKIVNYAYNSDNYRDTNGQIETNKPVLKEYIFFVRKLGSWLFDSDNLSMINQVNKDNDYLNKYEITIIANCDYLLNIDFATIKQLK